MIIKCVSAIRSQMDISIEIQQIRAFISAIKKKKETKTNYVCTTISALLILCEEQTGITIAFLF